MRDRPHWGDLLIPEVAKEQIGNQVFDENQVQAYYLTFSDEEYARLMDLSTILNPKNPYEVNEDRYVEARFKVGNTELPGIGVRFNSRRAPQVSNRRRLRPTVEPAADVRQLSLASRSFEAASQFPTGARSLYNQSRRRLHDDTLCANVRP